LRDDGDKPAIVYEKGGELEEGRSIFTASPFII
jgi:hypothetical protein